MKLVEQPMRLKYLASNGTVVDAGRPFLDEDWYNDWLDAFTRADDQITFLVVETTDIFEKEFDFNTVVSYGPDGVIMHTYNPECPEGCRGQRGDCSYRERRLVQTVEFPRSKGSW